MKMFSLVRFVLAALAFCLFNSVATAMPVGDVSSASSVPSNAVLGSTAKATPDVVDVADAGESPDVILREKRDTTTTCLPPQNVTVLFQRLNQHIDTSTLLQPASLAHPSVMLTGELNVQNAGISLAYGDKTCPSDVETSPGSPLFVRSTCPWFIRLEELPLNTYFPSILPQAECRCQKCLRSTSSVLGCERVITSIRVLHYTGCQDGFKTYVTETRQISVGCTCATPAVAVSGSTTPHAPVDDYAE